MILGDKAIFFRNDKGDHFSVGISAGEWYEWCNRFARIVIEQKAYRYRSKTVLITDPGGDSPMLTVWGIQDLILLTFPNHTELKQHFCAQLRINDEIFERDRSQLCHYVFNALKDDQLVKDLLRKQCSELVEAETRAAKELRIKAIDALALHYDTEIGLPVQFIMHDHNPNALYFIVGDGLYFVDSVATYMKDGTAVKRIGTVNA